MPFLISGQAFFSLIDHCKGQLEGACLYVSCLEIIEGGNGSPLSSYLILSSVTLLLCCRHPLLSFAGSNLIYYFRSIDFSCIDVDEGSRHCWSIHTNTISLPQVHTAPIRRYSLSFSNIFNGEERYRFIEGMKNVCLQGRSRGVFLGEEWNIILKGHEIFGGNPLFV